MAVEPLFYLQELYMKIKQPTYTTLIEEFLRNTEDTHTYEQIYTRVYSLTGNATMNQISAACSHLKRHGVIDFIVETDGTVWWYALPKDNDDRSRVIDERTPETKPRNRRRKVTIIIHTHDDDEGEQA